MTNKQQQCLYFFNYLSIHCDKNNNNLNYYHLEDCKNILKKTYKCDMYEDLSKYRSETQSKHKKDLSTFPSVETLRYGVRAIGIEQKTFNL